LHTFEAKARIGPSTPQKKESPTMSTKARAKGLSQKEKDILEFLKDDPQMRQFSFKKFWTKKLTQMMTLPVRLLHLQSHNKKNDDYQDSQDPYEL